MTASTLKLSRRAGRIEVLRKHERATWSVLQDHIDACWSCRQFYRVRNAAVVPCLDGRAAYDEWQIASRRHLDALGTIDTKGEN